MAVSRVRRPDAPTRPDSLVLACLLLLLVGCDRGRQAVADEARVQEEAAAAANGAAEPLAHQARWVEATSGGPVAMTLRLDSHLMVERNVGVTARRDGLVEEIAAERGDRVKEGQLLARLDSRDLLLAEKAAGLELEKQEASFARARKLRDESIIPGEEFEQTQLRRDAAAAQLDQIRHQLTRCDVRAPFDGVISGRYVEKGQFIMEDDRRVLFQVTALGPLLARVYAPEWAHPWLREGQAAAVLPQAGTGDGPGGAAAAPARIRWINDVLDAASGTVELLVEIVASGRASALRPGMSVTVELSIDPAGEGGTIVSLPREAFGEARLTPGQRFELTLLSADGSRNPRAVTLGLAGDGRVEVRSGLAAGDRVLLPE